MTPSSPVGAARVSLLVSIALLATKLVAWALTDSAAILSDALESVINVAAAGFALFSVRLAARPADANHPYGHGKIEYLSAGFEGGLIALAGLAICYTAIEYLVTGHRPGQLTEGLVLTAVAGAVNLALGLWLKGVATRTKSLTLLADAEHVLSDVWTTVAVLLGLGLVMATGWAPFDPLVAFLAAANLTRSGARLLRRAVAGLMDEADPEARARIAEALDGLDDPLLVGWSALRSRRHGALTQVDLTIHVPGDTSVSQAHALADRVELAISEALEGAVVICHVEPG